MKQAENFRVRELMKKIESHPHRGTLQADLQQKNVYNPFSNDSRAMIREMGNVKSFQLCETIPKVQYSECFLYWNQRINIFINGDWMFSQSRTTSSRRSDFEVFGTAKLRHRKSFSQPTMHGKEKISQEEN